MINLKSIVANGTDFNSIIKSGFYRINDVSKYTNAPPSAASYGQMLVITGGNDTIAQVVFPYNNSGHFYLRTGVSTLLGGSSNSWQDWKEYKSA